MVRISNTSAIPLESLIVIKLTIHLHFNTLSHIQMTQPTSLTLIHTLTLICKPI